MGPLVSADWLAASIARPDVRVADVRWYLGGRKGRDEHASGHLPGAVFLDVDTDLADPPGPAVGRHPLPAAERFAAAMERAGIGNGTFVVAYDDAGGAIAARLWWLLGAFGHAAGSAVLDGGIQAWRAAGHAIDGGPVSPLPSRFSARLDARRIVDLGTVDRWRRDPRCLVLDARAADRYAGVTEPIDARPGHVPGARSAPFADNLLEGRLRPAAALRERFLALGAGRVDAVVCYCGSGVTACHDILALELAGFPGALLYPGSYSQWAADPTRDVARD